MFAEKIRSSGARVFRVGGCVRDSLMGKTPRDVDYVICGMEETDFCRRFPEAKKVGRKFPVYLLEISGRMCEAAFARRERKTGRGYRGFCVEFGAEVSIEEDLFRRDTAMNSMAEELPEGNLIDPYGGRKDIEKGIIRAVSEHFMEDPVRALRAARQAAEHGFSIEPGTLAYMNRCGDELGDEPQERILNEFKMALAAERPSIFFRSLQAAGLLRLVFPEVYQLRGKNQPVYFHPEGDAYEHSLLVLDKTAGETGNLAARFAALTHDIGKGTTPEEMLPHHYNHEKRGLAVLAGWDKRMTLPKLWVQAASLVISQHMRAPRLEKPGKIVELLLAVDKSCLPFSDFNAIIRADHGGLPFYLQNYENILRVLHSISGKDCPKYLEGKEIGRWIRAQQVRNYMMIEKECSGGGEHGLDGTSEKGH